MNRSDILCSAANFCIDKSTKAEKHLREYLAIEFMYAVGGARKQLHEWKPKRIKVAGMSDMYAKKAIRFIKKI